MKRLSKAVTVLVVAMVILVSPVSVAHTQVTPGISEAYAYTASQALSYTFDNYLVNNGVSKKKKKVYKKKLKAAVKSLKLAKKANRFQKFTAIYRYIENNVTYGRTKTCGAYTAYAALVGKKAVCQGYACLLYDMCKQAGIPCKIILGKAWTGSKWGSHAWNIVKFGKKWYNVDLTWDDDTSSWNYFLKSQKKFTDHKRDKQFSTKKFNKKFPMTKGSYLIKAKTATTVNVNPGTTTTLKLHTSQTAKTLKGCRTTWSAGSGVTLSNATNTSVQVHTGTSGAAIVKAVNKDTGQTVSFRVNVKTLGLTNASSNSVLLGVGESTTLTAAYSSPVSSQSSRNISWTSSDPAIVSVSGNGLSATVKALKGNGARYVKITATSRLSGETTAFYVAVSDYTYLNDSQITTEAKEAAAAKTTLTFSSEVYVSADDMKNRVGDVAFEITRTKYKNFTFYEYTVDFNR